MEFVVSIPLCPLHAAASAGAEDPHEYEMQQYFDRI